MRKYVNGFGLTAIMIAVLSGVFTYSDWRTETQLDKDGVDGIGVVTDRYTKSARRGGTSYYITYSYTVGSKTYAEDESIPEEDWNLIQVGQQVNIRYSTSKPDVNVLAGDEPNIQGLVVFSLVAGIVGVLTLLFAELTRGR